MNKDDLRIIFRLCELQRELRHLGTAVQATAIAIIIWLPVVLVYLLKAGK